MNRDGNRALAAVPLVTPLQEERPGLVKIGDVARRFGISVHTIRLYEKEGLLISLRSKRGTRWYSASDLEWISTIRSLLDSGLNFEGIRRLLAQLPCWALRPCLPESRWACSMRFEARLPCWIAPEKLCTEKLSECYHCPTYRQARDLINLKTRFDLVQLEQV